MVHELAVATGRGSVVIEDPALAAIVVCTMAQV
jgi:hypothetical protein